MDVATLPRKLGRPAKLRACTVCKIEKKTGEFPNPNTAKEPGRCKECRRKAAALRDIEIQHQIELRQGDVEKARQKAKLSEQEKEERTRLNRLRNSESVAQFKKDLEERAAARKGNEIVAAFFKTICTTRCECCYTAAATGQDSIGFRHWCSVCGYGIERSGRCLAHPGGEIYYPGLPQDVVLPAELIAQIRPPPAPPQEAPTKLPDGSDLT